MVKNCENVWVAKGQVNNQRGEKMGNVIGVDIGKYDCVAMKNGSKEPLKFKNNQSGYQDLKKFAGTDTRIVMESTGHYGINIVEHLKRDGQDVGVIDPALYSSFRKSIYPDCKTDKNDAELMGTFISVNPKALSVPDYNELKPLTRLRYTFARELSKTKQRLVMHMDLIFPEIYREVFPQMGKAALAVLQVYTTPEKVQNLSAEELGIFLQKHSKGKLGKEKAQELINHAKQSFGIKNKGYEAGLKLLANQVIHLKKQIKELEKEIETQMPETNLETIPGIGRVIAATIIAEAGGKEEMKARTIEQFRGFAGLKPRKYQSGQYEAKDKLTKRGNKFLRSALYLGALSAIQHAPDLKAVYQRKLAAGKPKKVALCLVASKLANRVYVILTEDRPYILEGRPKKSI